MNQNNFKLYKLELTSQEDFLTSKFYIDDSTWITIQYTIDKDLDKIAYQITNPTYIFMALSATDLTNASFNKILEVINKSVFEYIKEFQKNHKDNYRKPPF